MVSRHRRGVDLAAAFFGEAVAPVIERHRPGLAYAAALLGRGSEVLGFDDQRSTDHDWGPRLQILLADTATEDEIDDLRVALDRGLPELFESRPVRFADSHDPVVRHRVEVSTRRAWFRRELGFDSLEPLEPARWVGVPTHRLAEVVGGQVFHDVTGETTRSRDVLRWYPPDAWRWVLAGEWRRIADEESFPGRCAERGDHLGARVVVARLVEAIMRLWLLQDRVYPPYAKWLGTAFARLPGADAVVGDLDRAVAAPDWSAQERHLGSALVATARRQNTLGISAVCDPTLRPFHDRPFLVIGADRFADALLSAVRDPALRSLPLRGPWSPAES